MFNYNSSACDGNFESKSRGTNMKNTLTIQICGKLSEFLKKILKIIIIEEQINIIPTKIPNILPVEQSPFESDFQNEITFFDAVG